MLLSCRGRGAIHLVSDLNEATDSVSHSNSSYCDPKPKLQVCRLVMMVLVTDLDWTMPLGVLIPEHQEGSYRAAVEQPGGKAEVVDQALKVTGQQHQDGNEGLREENTQLVSNP